MSASIDGSAGPLPAGSPVRDCGSWEADDEGFVDGESRPQVYVVAPDKVLVFGKDPHSQTTYRP